MGVGSAIAIAVGEGVAHGLGVDVGVAVGDGSGVAVGVAVAVGLGGLVGETVGVAVAEGVAVPVAPTGRVPPSSPLLQAIAVTLAASSSARASHARAVRRCACRQGARGGSLEGQSPVARTMLKEPPLLPTTAEGSRFPMRARIGIR